MNDQAYTTILQTQHVLQLRQIDINLAMLILGTRLSAQSTEVRVGLQLELTRVIAN